MTAMIGILGGTFDPVHYGHLRTALDVQEALGLSEIRLIPLRNPPHRNAPLAPASQRLALLRAAIRDNPGFAVDTRELERSGKSYSVDTLLSLKQEQPERVLCLLLGSDAFDGFPTWHEPERILQLAHLVVMQRPGEPEPRHYPECITHHPDDLRQTPAGRILPQPVTQLDISATRIRALLREGRSPRYLLPDDVLALIHRQRLYRAD